MIYGRLQPESSSTRLLLWLCRLALDNFFEEGNIGTAHRPKRLALYAICMERPDFLTK